MTVFSIVANDNSVGTTIGTFDGINGRNGVITLTEGTKGLCGIAVNLARAAQTTGTAMLARLRMSSASAKIAEGSFDVALGFSTGGGIATQSGGQMSPVEFLPVDVPAPSNGGVSFSLSQSGIEPADNFEAQVGLLHYDARPGNDWFLFSGSGGIKPLQGAVSSNGGSTTTARTSLTSVTVPGYLRSCWGYRAIQAQDPVQATAEAGTAFTDLSTTIKGITPQEFPTDGVGAALAGTLVGLGLWDWSPILPCYWTKGPGTESVEPFVTGLDALTAANAYFYGFMLRGD